MSSSLVVIKRYNPAIESYKNGKVLTEIKKLTTTKDFILNIDISIDDVISEIHNIPNSIFKEHNIDTIY